PRSPFSPQQDHLPVSLPDPVLAARASRPDPARWLFRKISSTRSYSPASNTQSQEPSVSVINSDLMKPPSVLLPAPYPIRRMTCGSQPAWPKPMHYLDLPAPPVRGYPVLLRDQNLPAARRKEQ